MLERIKQFFTRPKLQTDLTDWVPIDATTHRLVDFIVPLVDSQLSLTPIGEHRSFWTLKERATLLGYVSGISDGVRRAFAVSATECSLVSLLTAIQIFDVTGGHEHLEAEMHSHRDQGDPSWMRAYRAGLADMHALLGKPGRSPFGLSDILLGLS